MRMSVAEFSLTVELRRRHGCVAAGKDIKGTQGTWAVKHKADPGSPHRCAQERAGECDVVREDKRMRTF